MKDNNVISTAYYEKWKYAQHAENKIVVELQQEGLDSLQIIEILTLFKKKHNDEKQTLGFILMAIGAFIGFLSCIFTMLDFAPDLRWFLLYGLTSIAIVIITAGLYFAFE